MTCWHRAVICHQKT